MHRRIHPRTVRPLTARSRQGAALLTAVALSACLDRDVGGNDTTNVVLSTSTGDGSTSEPGDSSTTRPGIETTTLEPDDTSTSDGSASTASTEAIPPTCGDGKVDPDEECDEGPANSDEGACTAACNVAVCGDGHVQKDVEVCDDAESNGTYGACSSDCKGLGPRCGDGELQPDEGEQCDDLAPQSGCLKDACTWAASCLELKDAWLDGATSGLYTIRRNNQPLSVWCDMTSDGGGYTFLKNSSVAVPAKDAELKCDQYGMNLFIPRSQQHLAAAIEVAGSPELGPVDGGAEGDLTTYLKIMGIYPVTPGTSCPGLPLNSSTCPQWKASDGGPFWVTDKILDVTEPSTSNCADCSLSYIWDPKLDPPLVTYEAFKDGGIGAKSTHFLCDVGDKKPPT